MSAVFGTPVAATLFGVELLAFEFRPRSMVLIGLAAATADGLRMVMANAGLVAPQPIFPVPAHAPLGGVVLLGAAAVGVATRSRRLGHDPGRLPLRGPVQEADRPPALDVVADDRRPAHRPRRPDRPPGARRRLRHHPRRAARPARRRAPWLLLFVVKLVIWSGALGSGTSGGILAPIMMMGAALGGILGHVLPGATPGRVGPARPGRGASAGSPAHRSPPSSSPSSSPTTRTACSPCWWPPPSPTWSACWCSSGRS